MSKILSIFKKNFKIQDRVAICLSSIAIMISIISLIKSCEQTDISKRSYYLNLDPILNLSFDLDIVKSEYALIIQNDGANPLYDIKLRKSNGLLSLKSMEFITRVSQRSDSLISNKLNPDQNIRLPLKFSEFQYTFDLFDHLNISDNIESIIPVHCYYMSYRREPDKKIYYINKYLFLLTNSKKDAIFPSDPESLLHRPMLEIRNALEKIDELANKN